jgi:hypothetical protein
MLYKEIQADHEDSLLALTFALLACTPALKSSKAVTVCSHDKHASVMETPYLSLRIGSLESAQNNPGSLYLWKLTRKVPREERSACPH